MNPRYLALTAISAALNLSAQNSAHTPTWTDGIACIVYSHCTNCHNPGGVAPFSLLTYNDVFQNRQSIGASVAAFSMPPFPPADQPKKFAHANTLTAHERAELLDWVANFAPLGDANAIPPIPSFSSGPALTQPDVQLRVPNYPVNTTQDLYRVFVLPLNNSTDKFIKSIEVVPSNRAIVHHALIFQDTSSLPVQLDANDPGPGYTAFGGTGSPSSTLITGYVPGQGAFEFPTGFGSKVLANSNLLVQIHYPAFVSNQIDSTEIRIVYSNGAVRNVTTSPVLNHIQNLVNGPLVIPANQIKTFKAVRTVPYNLTLTALMPHMHLLGKSFKAGLVHNGDSTQLVHIPNWDFHWQGFYTFKTPIFLPQGSSIWAEVTYDNTSANWNNPNSPPQTVTAGEGTGDEMLLLYMNLSGFQAGDTLLNFDPSPHWDHDSASCVNYQIGTSESGTITPVSVQWVRSEHRLYGDEYGPYQVIDATGRQIARGIWSGTSIQLFGLKPGVYQVQWATKYARFVVFE
jgi:hypothetical protein